MKTKLMTMCAAAMICGTVARADLVYNITPFTSDGWTLTEGTITTDGTLGILTTSNILSVTTVFDNGSGPINVPVESWQASGNVTADADAFYLPAPMWFQSSGFGLGTGGEGFLFWGNRNDVNAGVYEAYRLFVMGGREDFDPTKPLTIATYAVPEPAAVPAPLLLAGLGSGIVARIRRRK